MHFAGKNAEKKMEDLPMNPSIVEIWRSLFDKENKTPLQKLVVTVNVGHPVTKKKNTDDQEGIRPQIGQQHQQN